MTEALWLPGISWKLQPIIGGGRELRLSTTSGVDSRFARERLAKVNGTIINFERPGVGVNVATGPKLSNCRPIVAFLDAQMRAAVGRTARHPVSKSMPFVQVLVRTAERKPTCLPVSLVHVFVRF